jgi:bleomycin hydrolase
MYKYTIMSSRRVSTNNSRSSTRSRKRRRFTDHQDDSFYPSKKQRSVGETITSDFIKHCREAFNSDPSNVATRNAVTMVGSTLASTNSKRANQVSHVFMNTVKPKNLRATDQGHSGRCWMFSGLNVLRNIVIKSLGIEHFEFSETYLYFWDKWERSNAFLTEMIDNPNISLDNRYMEYLLNSCLEDGGWWNMFANLVSKYGLMPKSAFGETYQSQDSTDMNNDLRNYLISAANYIYEHPELSEEQKHEIRKDTLEQIHSMLCKHLGEPPAPDQPLEGFDWAYTNDDYESTILGDLTPLKFKDLVMPTFNLDDYVVLAHVPDHPSDPNSKQQYQKYEVASTTNILGGQAYSFVNVPIETLKKYTMNVIGAGLPVWFAADVGRHFHYWLSALDEDLFDHESTFGEQYNFDKAQRVRFRQTSACHAMVFTGFNADEDGPTNWQVENSWGYWNEEIPGLDGWLTMSDKWFTENVFQVAIHKNFIKTDDSEGRHLRRIIDEEDPIILPPWDNFAPAAFKMGQYQLPENYKDKEKSLPMMKRMLRVN